MTDEYNAATRPDLEPSGPSWRVWVTHRKHSTLVEIIGPATASVVTLPALTSDHEVRAWLEGTGWQLTDTRIQRGNAAWEQNVVPIL